MRLEAAITLNCGGPGSGRHPIVGDSYIQRMLNHEKKFGFDSAKERSSNLVASLTLGRQFGESMDDYLKRNPDAKEFMDWHEQHFGRVNAEIGSPGDGANAPNQFEPKLLHHAPSLKKNFQEYALPDEADVEEEKVMPDAAKARKNYKLERAGKAGGLQTF